jgi:hypothetical protein
MRKGLFLTIMFLLCVSLFAQVGENGAKPESAAPASPDVEALQTAALLAKYGYDTGSASALIGAAEILVYIDTQPLATAGTQSGQTADSGAKSGNPEYTPANLLADARRMAGRDATMLAWASEVEAEMNARAASAAGTRGSGSPKYQVDRVSAYSTIRYQLRFYANQWAEIMVSGDGDTDLDLYIYDTNGNLIAYDEGYTDDCYVRFIPRWTDYFTIVIKNLGRVYNQFQIWTN